MSFLLITFILYIKMENQKTNNLWKIKPNGENKTEKKEIKKKSQGPTFFCLKIKCLVHCMFHYFK